MHPHHKNRCLSNVIKIVQMHIVHINIDWATTIHDSDSSSDFYDYYQQSVR